MKLIVAITVWACCICACNCTKKGSIVATSIVREKQQDRVGKGLLSRGGSTSAMSQLESLAPVRFNLKSVHYMSANQCLQELAVVETMGLSPEEASYRLQVYGHNVLSTAPTKPLWHLVLEQFQDKLVQILLSVALLSAILASLENDAHAFTEPLIILSILVINAAVGVLQSRSAEASLDALKKLQPVTACVLRQSVWQSELPASQIVPGDILYLRVGDKIPADARILALKTVTFGTDESSLTGESLTASKCIEPVDENSTISGKSNMVFSGTMVTHGGCFAVVTATGMATEIGLIDAGVQAAKMDHMHIKTPLAEKLDEFGGQLTKIIGAICAAVWVVSIPKFKSPVFKSQLQGAIYYAKIAVALGVAAIPEGLPAVITLCLSLGTRRMAARNVIVRKLPSVETLGCTSVICTDKTGTLTTNQMTVKSLVTMDKKDKNDKSGSKKDAAVSGDVEEDWPWEEKDDEFDDESEQAHQEQEYQRKHPPRLEILERSVEGVSYEPVGAIEGMPATISPLLQDIAAISALCNDANLEFKDGQYSRVGEPTEAALKVLAEKIGVPGLSKRTSDPFMLAHECSDYWNTQYVKLATLEFSRDRKSMSVLVRVIQSAEHSSSPAAAAMTSNSTTITPTRLPSRKSQNRLFVKGAAEVLVGRCNRVKLDDGTVVPLDADTRRAYVSKFSSMANRPLRCLALAYREGDSLGDLGRAHDAATAAASSQLQNPDQFVHLEKDLVLVGLCGIKDPARPEVAQAILRCRDAGVRVMMMTGDSKETAIAIAKEVNIFGDAENADIASSAFTGKEFFALPQDRQMELLRTGNKVFCRTEPKDKQRLISMLDSLEEITAMTGDGVNDAPALQQASIGIAMGITGTEVAKEAADMILADDNFATIVSAVEEGRNIYSNMQTFVCFLISCNIGEIATMLFSTILGIPEPLTPLHLLWVNLVTDGPPATALGFNPPDPRAMMKPPRARHESILSPWLLSRYMVTGLYVGFATIGSYVWWYLDKGELTYWTMRLYI